MFNLFSTMFISPAGFGGGSAGARGVVAAERRAGARGRSLRGRPLRALRHAEGGRGPEGGPRRVPGPRRQQAGRGRRFLPGHRRW